MTLASLTFGIKILSILTLGIFTKGNSTLVNFLRNKTDLNSELVTVRRSQVVDDEVLVADVVGKVDPVDVGVWKKFKINCKFKGYRGISLPPTSFKKYIF